MDPLVSIQRSLRVLVVLAVLVTVFFTRDLLLPILLGFLLALTLRPVARAMVGAGLPNAIAATILVLSAMIATVTIIAGSAGTVAMWSDEIPRMGTEIRFKLSGMTQAVEDVRTATQEVEGMTGSDGTQTVVLQKPGLIDAAFSTFLKTGATLIVTFVLALLVLASGDMYYRKVVQAFQTLSDKKRALNTIYDIERRVSRYLLTITIINAGLGVAVAAYLAALGMPNAYVWGIAAALFNFLPYIGGFIGSILVAAFALVQFDSVGYALLAPLGYQFLTAVEGQFLTPWLVGRRLSLNPVAVFLTVGLWAWLWGIPGALIAVPVLVVLKVICENFDTLRTVGIFLSGSDDTAAPASETPAAKDAVPSPGE